MSPYNEYRRLQQQYEEALRTGRIRPGRLSAAMWTITRWVLLFAFAAFIVNPLVGAAWPVGLVALALPVWCVWRLLRLIRR